MKKLYFLIFALLMGCASNRPIDRAVDIPKPKQYKNYFKSNIDIHANAAKEAKDEADRKLEKLSREKPILWKRLSPQTIEMALDQSKIVVVYMGSEKNRTSNRLEYMTFRDPVVTELLNDRFIPVKIDVDRDDIPEELKNANIPLIMFLTPHGEVLAAFHNFMYAEDLAQILSRVAIVWENN
jgi:hypothetical protein